MKIIPPGMGHNFFITINQEETDSGFGEIVEVRKLFKFDKYFCNIRKLVETDLKNSTILKTSVFHS